jgi:hypothetical protein
MWYSSACAKNNLYPYKPIMIAASRPDGKHPAAQQYLLLFSVSEIIWVHTCGHAD